MVPHKNRHMNQWNRIESPEINPHTYSALIFNKGGNNIQWGKNSLFNICCRENFTATIKRMKLEHFLTPYTKINPKWIKDQNVRLEIIKILKENIHRTLFDRNCSNIFLDLCHQAKETKAKINNWGLLNLQGFAQQRYPSTKQKDNILHWRKYFQMI